jgi:hypothetical protein
MEDAKRKQIETRLRRLIAADSHSRNRSDKNRLHISGEIRVIRRRKGSPDRHVIGIRNDCVTATADMS